ncbi:putative phytanoyl- dioxygenase protein [Neofusicoccum parvum UCRNP2]|uniref:Putative phytanoyl-dioxygenase protein n=1 Tax=Botryosphaeria parva (strain UCR-NP2) TaxID=1287680 RepID=R1ETY6_BOTPV|nr:putative phytanoyl- dioxygenase protein [Neofusicoccum parvum UCRNP2]
MTFVPNNPDPGFSSDIGGVQYQSTAYYLTLTSTIHEDKAPESFGSALGGIDMGFTKSSSAPALTIGIDTAQAGTPAATPGGDVSVSGDVSGDVSVSGEGFNTGIKPTLTGPTLILTEISGQFVLATVGATSAPATSAGTTTGLGGMILSGLGETGSSAPEQTTAASEPESPEQTTAPAESDSPEQTSAASEPDSPEQTTDAGLPVVTTAAPQEPESTAAAAAPTPVEVGGITVSQNSDTQLVVGSQTLEAGSTIVVGTGSSTTAVALETDGSSTHIVVGTATAAVPEATGSAEAAPSPIEVGGVTASQNAASEIVVGTQTLAPGSSIIVGSGSSTTAVALQTTDGTTQLVVGSSTAVVPAAAPASTASAPAPLEVDGVTVSQNTASQLVVGSQTLAPGSTITIGSGSSTTAIALHTASGSTQLVVGSTTAAIPTAAAAAPAIIFGSQTLHPGSTLTLGTGSRTTAVVLTTDAAGRSAVVVADASTTYTVAAGTSSASPTTTGARLLTAGGTTELAIGATTYTFKTGGPAIALSTRGGTTVVVAGTGSAQSLIAIPTGLAEGDESSSSSSHPPSRNGTEQSS